jgi:NitT/TauT family transport system substrate-binding protein
MNFMMYIVRGIASLATSLVLTIAIAHAEELAITNYGISPTGIPYAIAMAKGYFKDEGLNITGIISSQGGGTGIRNMLAGGIAYGEVNPGAVVAAIQQGVDLKIIADTVPTLDDILWVVKPDSRIKSVNDLKGAKIGYTNPKSTSEALNLMLLDAAKLKVSDVELVRTGGFGEGLASVSAGLIDVMPVGGPVYYTNQKNFRIIARGADVLPLLNNVVAITSAEAAKTRGDFLRAVLRARRKAAEFLYQNPDESAEIVSKAFKMDPAIAMQSIHDLVAIVNNGVRNISDGQIHLKGLQDMLALQKRIGAIEGDIDVTKFIDTSFLPPDIQTIR